MSFTVDTHTIRLFVAGDAGEACRLLRQECYPPNEGLCVTVTPTTFIYSGGSEVGVEIGFVNYPRFPTTEEELWSRACVVAARLVVGLCQWSALLVGPTKTEWINKRPEGR